MDSTTLVKASQHLLGYLEKTEISPRAVLWVTNTEYESWKLWIVPKAGFNDRQRFYRILSETISNHHDELGAIDISAIEMKEDGHPALQGIGKIFRVQGPNSVHLSGNTFNGFYMPDGVIIHMAM